MSDWKPTLIATGIGTLPMDDPDRAVDLILARLPEIPFWPQLSARSPWEDMVVQAAPGLPAVKIDLDERRVTIDPEADRAKALTEFYTADMAGEHDRFALTPETAPGYFALNDRAASEPGKVARLKGHVAGPVTFSLACQDPGGRAVIHDDELSQAFARGLGLKGGWQAANFTETPERGLIFLDEPALTGFGSAFMPLEREAAAELLSLSVGAIHEAGGLAGIHVCGNTDWSLPLSLELDVVNFDAHDYGEGFLLYPKQIHAFLERGGVLAWGIVPTLAFSGDETADKLALKLDRLITSLAHKGINRHTIIEQSLLTPACGMGSLELETAERILELLAEVSETMRA